MSTGKAKELAREAVAQAIGVDDASESEMEIAEYAVNLALDAACKAVCQWCREVQFENATVEPAKSVSGNIGYGHRVIQGDGAPYNIPCQAAAIRAMRDSGRPA